MPRIKEIHEKLSSSDAPTTTAYFSSLVDKLQTNPSKDCPPGNDPSKLEQTYDGMLISLLKMVSEKSRDKVKEAGTLESEKTDRLAKELNAEMAFHVKNLADTIAGHKKEVAVEIGEQQKHITMDDLHDGFESKVSFPFWPVAHPVYAEAHGLSTYLPLRLLHPLSREKERRRRMRKLRRRRPRLRYLTQRVAPPLHNQPRPPMTTMKRKTNSLK